MEFIDLKTQYKILKPRIDKRIQSVLDHGRFIMGPEVLQLESELADYVGIKHCVTCANGTDALSLALMALDVKENDIVFCPTFTFFATAESVAHIGATPVFVDSCENTFNICPIDLEKQIKKAIKNNVGNLKAIITVDLFGLPANYPELTKIAKRYDLKIIEDAAQGFGGTINGKKSGSFGDISTTSFFPAKPLGCFGDGGAVFTNSDILAATMRSLRVHGKGQDKYDNVRIGVNSRLDTIQAAILLEKLAVFDNEVKNRNEIAEFYNKKYGKTYKTPLVPVGFKSSWAQYTLIVGSERSTIKESFLQKGIPTMIYYEKCLHLQPAFKYLNYKKGDFPVAERLSNTVLSLPMHPYPELILKTL